MPTIAEMLAVKKRQQERGGGTIGALLENPLMARKAAMQRGAVDRPDPNQNYPQGWEEFVQNMAKAYPVPATGGTQEQIMAAAKQAAINAGPGIVATDVAKGLRTARSLPQSGEFSSAVSNTPGAQITPDGLLMNLQRNQLPDQALMPSVRGGVFYLPKDAAQAKHYSTGRNGYGGSERISGETLISNPMFVKGATGGKAPQAAFDTINGKGAYEQMRRAALDVNWGRKTGGGTDVEAFLEKFAPELRGQGQYILENSKQGNQLAYALQEAAVASAARNAGHDAVLGYSTSRNTKQPFISEVFDVREMNYPDKFGTRTDIWDAFLK